ncbi:hypothetical protein CYMTET_32274, partial [Cymbomonas tetramitiformis]
MLLAEARDMEEIKHTKWLVVILFKDCHTVQQMDMEILQHAQLDHVDDVRVQPVMDQDTSLGFTQEQYTGSDVQRHSPDRRMACRIAKAIRPSVSLTGRTLAEEVGLLTADYCLRHDIEPQQRHGSPYLHEKQQPGKGRWRGLTEMYSRPCMARALLMMNSGLGVELWPLAVRHAVYILDQTFRKSLGWTSAHYILDRTFRKSLGWTSAHYRRKGKRADPSLLQVFGCVAHAYTDPDVHEHKLSDRSWPLGYVGHSEVSSAYLLYDTEAGQVVASGMVVFSERLAIKLGEVITSWDPAAMAPLKTNFTVTTLDAPFSDLSSIPCNISVLAQSMHTCLAGEKTVAAVEVPMMPDGVTDEPRKYREVLTAPDADLWLEAIHAELEALVRVKHALEMTKDGGGSATCDAFIMAYESRMRRSDVEPCLYFICDGDLTIFILFYVDEYLVATDYKDWYHAFVMVFHSTYASTDLGVLDLVMGIGVRCGDDAAYLSQKGPDIMAAVSVMYKFCITYGSWHFVALKQRCVPLSTTGAEIITMSEGARVIKYVLNALNNLVE